MVGNFTDYKASIIERLSNGAPRRPRFKCMFGKNWYYDKKTRACSEAI